jgi:polysaccharide biosynthesis transport protein
MPEDFEEQDKEPLDLSRYLDLIRRRHMQFLIPMLAGWMLVVGASWVLPKRFKSSTLILVEQPTVPKDYVVSNISDDIEQRLQSIQQQIESRTRLLRVIDDLHLYSIRHHPMTPDEKVARMTKDIDIELVRDPGSDTINSFSVSYSAPTAKLAQQVTSELTTLFINENQQQLEQESVNTTKFIAKQLDDASANLAKQEANVKQFQSEHEGELPSQEASNLQILSGLQSQLQNEEDALATASQQRILYQSMLDQYRSMHPAVTADGAPSSLATVDEQLQKMRAQLADLNSRYTDRYPAVQNLKAQIAKTEKLRDQMLGAAAKPAASQNSARDLPAGDPSSTVVQVQSQLQANQIEIANRQRAISELKARIDSYQARLNAEPASEQQLADLTRGYEQSQANYNDLLKKKNESEMATSMEQMQEGERFSVIDPPGLPLKPAFPDPLKFCGIGLGVGLALGAAVAGGLEFLDDRMHSDKEIDNLLPAAIILEIPEIVTSADAQRNRMRMTIGWATAAVVALIILGGSVFSYLHA